MAIELAEGYVNMWD